MKITKTTNPKPIPQDESKLGFGSIFTDHMLIKKYKDGAWQDSEIVPYGPISLDPAAACLHYGQEVFEGMKAYKNSQGEISLFRPEENFARLNKSNERMGIPKLDEAEVLADLIELLNVEKDWVPTTFGTSAYIRPFIIATEAGLGVHAATEYLFMIIIASSGSYYKNGLQPVSIYVEDEFVRAVVGGTGTAKTGGNYAASLIAQEKAVKLGYNQVLWLDGKEGKYIEEVGAMNVMFVLKDKIITPELSGSILEGITRKSVIELACKLGFTIEERKIEASELVKLYQNGELLEAFGTGTAAVISPIGKLHYKGTDMVLCNGEIGEVSQKIYDELTGIQYGKKDDSFNWVLKI